MAGGGDYLRYQQFYTSKVTDVTLTAIDGSKSGIIAPKNSSHTIYIQRIVFSPTTFAARTLTFQDNATTPVPIALVSVPATAPSAGTASNNPEDFGPIGTPLTQGASLDMILSAAGVAGRAHIEAYEKLTGPASA